jgi:hypothetical protein
MSQFIPKRSPPCWPPYGHMPASWEEVASKGNLPAGFVSESQWQAFVDDLLASLTAALWPQYDGSSWEGAAVDHMEALSLADLRLMAAVLQAALDQSVGGAGTPTHRSLFIEEDELAHGRRNYDTVKNYLQAAPPALVDLLVASAGMGAREILGPRPLIFKRRLQRPRPMQVSMLLQPGLKFHCLQAKSACSPSMMSGHSLQGLFVATYAYVENQQGVDQVPGGRQALAKFGVDLGDRRVFAGVHYPSDNLASWYIAWRLAPVVFGTKVAIARSFMWEAVQTSAVLQALRQAGETEKVLGRLLTWFNAAMT